jgi:hypothetical protein
MEDLFGRTDHKRRGFLGMKRAEAFPVLSRLPELDILGYQIHDIDSFFYFLKNPV